MPRRNKTLTRIGRFSRPINAVAMSQRLNRPFACMPMEENFGENGVEICHDPRRFWSTQSIT